MVTCAAAASMPGSRYNNGEMYAALRSPHAGDWPDLELFPILLPLAAPPPAPGCATTFDAGSAATTTRPAPAASAPTATRARSSTPACASAGSRGCASPTRRCCR